MASDLILIGGRSGTGKTSVAFEVHERLSADGVMHCLIDGDSLDMAYPAPDATDLAGRNLAAIWQNYRSLGHHRLIYVNTLCVLPNEIDRLTAAMGAEPDVIAILLTCSDDTAQERLTKREIGSALATHLTASATAAARLNAGVSAAVHQIPTDGRTVTDVAAHVIGRLNTTRTPAAADVPAAAPTTARCRGRA